MLKQVEYYDKQTIWTIKYMNYILKDHMKYHIIEAQWREYHKIKNWCINKNGKMHSNLKHIFSNTLHSETLTDLYVQFLHTVLTELINTTNSAP
jgi:hypothetical protein